MRGFRRAVMIAYCSLSACGSTDQETIGEYVMRSGAGDGGQDAAVSPQGDASLPPDAALPAPAVDSGSVDAGAVMVQPDACQSHVVQGASPTPDMLIVLDRSGSMNPDSNDQRSDRWGGSRSALLQVTAAYDERVNFGLMTFPGPAPQGTNGGDNCSMGVLDVPVGPDRGDAIASALSSMNADGRTPTALALQEALRVLGTVQVGPDQLTIPKYVLLVTDGDPNCSGSGGRGVDQQARTQTVAAIDALRMAGVKTYVVGYQTASSDFVDQLDSMAAAGGTGMSTHRSVENGDDLAMTVAELARKAVACSYQLEAPVSDPTRVLVTVGGRPRNRGQADDGWRLESDARTVTLLGAACDQLQQGEVFKVEVKCEVQPIF